MSNFNLSDILRYVLTGAYFVIGLFFIIRPDFVMTCNLNAADSLTVVGLVSLFACYLMGMFLQTLNKALFENRFVERWNLKNTFF